MKSNFALSLSFDGLRLMHRVVGGWHLVGHVALDDADVTSALARLKTAADTLEPNGIATKLLIPNDQIKYIAIDGTRAEAADVRYALHGATPYSVDDLAFDFAKGGGRTYVAAVARETLDEAQQFASEHGFNPVCFAAIPEPFTYVGEAFFGATAGQNVQRDDEPVIVIGDAAVDIPSPQVSAGPVAEDVPDASTNLIEPDVIADPIPDPESPEPLIEVEPDTSSEGPPTEPTPEEIIAKDTIDDVENISTIATPDVSADEAPEDNADVPAPVFASRLRADRNEGRPAPQASAPTKPIKRSEPTFSHHPSPSLVVPTGSGTDAMPPLSAPSRTNGTVPAAAKISTNTPDADVAPPVTGDAPNALPPEAAVAAASLTIDAVSDDTPAAPKSNTKSAAATAATTAVGAAASVGGAVGGMFASRRMARDDAKIQDADDTKLSSPDEKSRQTVFGARKKPQQKPKPVVGGKPRFLGLILTAILLLFLLAFAAFAALSEDGIASWFGFGSDDTQIATDQTGDQPDDLAVPEVAPDIATDMATDMIDTANVADALALPTPPAGAQVLSPENATRIYAATGVWQRAPRIPLNPRTTSIENLTLGTSPRPVPRVPASPLASASSVAGDALIATPIDPPAPDAVFNFGTDGMVIASEQGALTPDGILIFAGAPPLNPPTRPGTVAPEITPQDQLAAVIPETAVTIADAPDGVIVFAGRPAIEPPVRTATAAPAVAPTAAALASGDAPLLATDGLLVLAGSPPVLPPARPGTVAVPAAPLLSDTPVEVPTSDTPDNTVEGLNVIAGAPPVLPPARPGTVAPQNDAAADSLSEDLSAALSTGTAQIPTPDTSRPLTRPAAITQAAAVAAEIANAPAVGELTTEQTAAFRPRTRPAGLAPIATPDPEPVVAAVQAPAPTPTPTGLQISPEIAAAVLAAANRPNPIINPTAQAIPVSSRPDLRPRNMARIVERAAQTQARAATQVAAVAPRAVAPSGPTGNAVAQNATLDNAINLRNVNLIGIYGGSNDRRALVRLGNGRYVRVTVGDRLDGGRVTGISASALNYTKRGRALTLQVAG